MTQFVETRTSSAICIEINKQINALLTRLEKKMTNPIDIANVDRVKQRINLLRKTYVNGGEIIATAVGSILFKYREQVLTRDEEFLFAFDIDEQIGKVKDSAYAFVYDLFGKIKVIYQNSRPADRDQIFRDVKSLLHDYIGYCMVTKLEPGKWISPI